jgi:hypothetical protein
MSKFNDFFNKVKDKVKKIKPVQLIGVIIIISIVIWYIVSLFVNGIGPNKPKVVGVLCNTSGNDPTTRCDVGQQCQTQCKPNPQCSGNGAAGQKYYCDLKKWDKDCGKQLPYVNSTCGVTKPDNNVQCINQLSTTLDKTNGKQYQSLVADGNNCMWLTGFEKGTCKLTNTDDPTTAILYGDCIDNLTDSPYSFNDKIINNSFKCGYPQGTETKNPNSFNQQGQDGLLGKSSDTLNLDVFPCCSNPSSSKSGFANILSTDWDTIGTKSDGKLLGSNDKQSKNQNKNKICGVHESNSFIDGYMQILDCSQGGTIDNKSWKNYYTSLNCDSNGDDLDANRKCEVPCWMFNTPKKGTGGQGSVCDSTTSSCTISGGFPLECKWSSEECGGYDYSFDLFTQSCNYDSNGCTTIIGSDGSVLVPTFDGNNCTYKSGPPISVDSTKKGCRPIGDGSIMKGLYCTKSSQILNYITKTIPNFIEQSTNIGFDKITFTISNPTSTTPNKAYTDLITQLFYISKAGQAAPPLTLISTIYVVTNNKINLSKQIYITIDSENSILTFDDQSVNPSNIPDNVSINLKLTGSDNKIINFPPTTTGAKDSANFVTLSSITGNNIFFIGSSLQYPTKEIILNSIEYGMGNLNNIDLSASSNTFKFPI